MKAFLKILRALAGAAFCAALWGGFAWLASGRPVAALILAALSLLVLPIFVPWSLFTWARLSKRLVLLELKSESPLRDLVLQCVLRQGALRPRFWILNVEHDNGFLWFERGFGGSRRQEIFLPKAWLNGIREPSHLKEFRGLWCRISGMTPFERRLRSMQFRFWAGASAMLDLLFAFLNLIVRSLGLREMPHPAFWCQRFAWGIKRSWFGTEDAVEAIDFFPASMLRVDFEPLYWRSWIFGVWSRYPTRCLHPSWRVLVPVEGLLES